MTPTEYREACQALGISIYASAKVLGVSKSTANRYSNGLIKIPETAAKLLRALIKLGTTEI